ncbi:hypothetical protein AMIS_55340 [Actinoplanes missouriensis 431]|uniref:Antitoxin n=1 Tax=Actinoplanes missouriensis (strain ATCC 14538 / DSM 43046 / CBS 188.64 / JCM 3121 / NBRC 102363 / NCIMB 12654 / NRRL B-3342 / UNCC 431) TaxID=512565 RepID=I0HCL7_ACTM4|nr:hypothetical protein [Actinoplanes missouriensis]BAL90754.1 hypothetical protein AMIS_55340 [Actinoplanes missouriensis 431]
MGEPATPIRRRIELTIAEARLRFQQLVRVTGLTGQVTVVVDNGRPIAAIVPVTDLPEFSPPPPPPPPAPPPSAPARPPAAARPVAPVHAPPGNDGWLRRVEKVREDVRRQHAGRIRELTRALDEAWAALDTARPAGTDRVVDALRAAHADLRPPR